MAVTYLDAARQILADANKPLHYREITAIALESKLVEPTGKTPEMTMGAQLYLASKREPPEFRQAGRGQFALILGDTEPTLDKDIGSHNRKVQDQLLEFLHEMHPRQLELLVGQLLAAIGFEAVDVTRYSGDGGIDVDATLTVGGVTRVKTAIQVKRWKNNVSGSTVRELRGGLMTDQRGLIITTSGFTKDAIGEADAPGKTPISLIDGPRLIQLLVEKQIGVRQKAVSLLELNVAELLAEEPEQGKGDKSASLWPLPGGRARYFATLLEFLEYIGQAKPTIDQMVAWVMKNYEKVTKQKVVMSCLRSVLYSMGLCDFDGERVVLTEQGQALRKVGTKAMLVDILRQNVVGVEELLAFLALGPQPIEAIRAYLLKTLQLSWETNLQVTYRLHWLEACEAVRHSDDGWTLAAEAV